jgi:CRISPR/Cas system CMR subunit Cmr6 (Cas7 group RAMP superfamily)
MKMKSEEEIEESKESDKDEKQFLKTRREKRDKKNATKKKVRLEHCYTSAQVFFVISRLQEKDYVMKE